MRTLIVDDHQLFSAGLRLLLSALTPIELIERCIDGSSALKMAAETPFELVLLDWKLGSGPAGAPLVESLKELLPAARIVVISGEASPRTIRQAIDAGAVGFVPKESSPELMTAALTIAAQGGVYLPAAVLAAEAHESAIERATGLCDLADAYPQLSDRLRQVLALLARGMSNKVIARELDITEGTVKQHVNTIFREIGVSNRTEAVYLLGKRGVRFA